MGGMTSLRFCGQRVTVDELELIKETVRDCSGLSRTELAFTICELLAWQRPNGGLKGRECLDFLEQLEEEGLLKLPGFRGTVRSHKEKPKPAGEDPFRQDEPLAMALHDVGPVTLEVVETPESRRQWRDWVDRYHYLGCKVPFGAHLRYFVRVSRPQPQRVGCVQFSSPAWMMAARDEWIGWDHAQRTRRLQRIVQNSRFLIVPWVRVPYLASAALARMARRIPADWEARYAIRPVLMETLVDLSRFRGTCYRAANWISLGQTTGRGRMDRHHNKKDLIPKEVLVYPLCRKFREKLLQPPCSFPE